MPVYSIFTIINMMLAAWLVISAIAALHHRVIGRDARPLVMPVFTGLAFFFLAFSWLAKPPEEQGQAMTIMAWQMVHFGMLTGQLLFVRAYTKIRG